MDTGEAVKQRKRPRIGDIIEIPTPRGYAYAQYTHKVPSYGELLRILPGLYESRPADVASLSRMRERFHVFFPLGIATARGIVSIAGTAEIPEQARAFPTFRMAGGQDRSGRIRNWWLWDGREQRYVGQLTPEQCHLSIAEVWNDTLLIERLASRWSPADEC